MNNPNINVTPLINVPTGEPHPDTLVVTVNADSTLSLNQRSVGTTNESEGLVTLLKDTFAARIANGSVSESFADAPDRPMSDRIERTVFIKAPKTISYGSVARVVDAAKLAGAYPISLQIDRLD